MSKSIALPSPLGAVRAAVGRRAREEHGVFALRRFATGETIEHAPVITYPIDQADRVVATRLADKAFHWGPETQEGAVLLGWGSLYRHAHHPNASFRRDHDAKLVEIVAANNIEPGDEITLDLGEAQSDTIIEPLVDEGQNARPDPASATWLIRVSPGISPGRGRGMFASCEIRNRQVIERAPVATFPAHHYRALSNTTLADYMVPWVADEGSGALMLGFGSLYNHSYRPNSDCAFDVDREEVVFFALRDIREGEEITWNYSGIPSATEPVWFDLAPDNEGEPSVLPFVARVAAEWIDLAEATSTSDPALVFRQSAPLTGDLAVTANGNDVQFSDVGFSQ